MRESQIALNRRSKRVCSPEHAPRNPSHVLERRHGLTEILERGGGVIVEHHCVKWVYALSLYADPGATLDDLREAVATLEDVARTARRVLGGAHPVAVEIGESLRTARTVLRVRSDGGQVKFV